jgi:hypothetical protein
LRTVWKLVHLPAYTCDDPCPPYDRATKLGRFFLVASPQVLSTVLLHSIVWGMNFRSRRSGHRAARQEEVLLASLVALAVTMLVAGLTAENAGDHAYATFFIITAASYLKLRWWLGMLTLSVPTLAALVRSGRWARARNICDL